MNVLIIILSSLKLFNSSYVYILISINFSYNNGYDLVINAVLTTISNLDVNLIKLSVNY